MTTLLSPDQLEAELRHIGETRYHGLHPFHRMLHGGELSKAQVQAWALNRYCYQAHIPIKDATIMARIDDPALRRVWRQRIVDHDGEREGEGGIARWLMLTDGLGLDREMVTSMQKILPATRFAAWAYVTFVRERTLLEAIASSLTEMFSPTIIRERVAGMLKGYDFVSEETLAYFGKRLSEAPRDVDHALDYVKREARRPDQQQAVLGALRFKCAMLWTQLDALHFAYVQPGLIAPDAFDPAVDA